MPTESELWHIRCASRLLERPERTPTELNPLHYLLINGTELLALCCWWWFVRNQGGALRLLGLQLLLTNVVEILALHPALLPVLVPMYNIYLLFDLVLMSWMLVRFHPPLRRWAIGTSALLAVLWALETAWFGIGAWFNILFLLTSALAICAMSSAALWHLSQVERAPLQRSPLFWLLLGTVLYFGGIAPVFSSYNYLAKHGDIMSGQLYWIVRVLCAVRYLSVAWACIQWRREPNTATLA